MTLCRGFHRVEEPPEAPSGLCAACIAQFCRVLDEIPEIFVHLSMEMSMPGSGARGERVKTYKTAPIPLNSEAEALKRAVEWILADWALGLHTHLSTLGLQCGLRPANLVECCRFLDLMVSALVAMPLREVFRWVEDEMTPILLDGVEGIREIVELHRNARKFLGWTRQKERLQAPCRACSAAALVHRDGDEKVVCEACGDEDMTYPDYLTWAAALVGSKAKKT